MNQPSSPRCIAFDGMRRVASGDLLQVALKAKKLIDKSEHTAVLLFDFNTSERIDIDFHGTPADVSARLAKTGGSAASTAPAPTETPRGPGRPRLGVVAREVTLLPRHWDWLNVQPGGASVALRKLVEGARRVNGGKDRVRQAQEAAYRFMSPVAGHLPGFEEATRALFAGNAEGFQALLAHWPADVREHARRLAAPAFTAVAKA